MRDTTLDSYDVTLGCLQNSAALENTIPPFENARPRPIGLSKLLAETFSLTLLARRIKLERATQHHHAEQLLWEDTMLFTTSKLCFSQNTTALDL